MPYYIYLKYFTCSAFSNMDAIDVIELQLGHMLR